MRVRVRKSSPGRDHTGEALLPSASNPNVRRWQKVGGEGGAPATTGQATEAQPFSQAAMPQTTEAEAEAEAQAEAQPTGAQVSDASPAGQVSSPEQANSAIARQVGASSGQGADAGALPPEVQKHLKQHGDDLARAVARSPLSDKESFEKKEASRLKFVGRSELRNHRNMLRLVGFAVASAIPPVGKKMTKLRQEQRDRHHMDREEARVAAGYLAQYAWSMMPQVGYSAAVKAGVKIALTKAGIAAGSMAIPGVGMLASLAAGTFLVWKGISWALKKTGKDVDPELFDHIAGASQLTDDARLEGLSTFAGKSLSSSSSLEAPEGVLGDAEAAQLAHHTAEVMQPLLADAFGHLSHMMESGELPEDFQEDLANAVAGIVEKYGAGQG